MKTQDGRLFVVSGASRSGKTVWVLRKTAKHRRIFAWDPEAQWCEVAGFKKATTRAQLMAFAQQKGPLKVAFVAGGDIKAAFDFWAGCVMYAGRWVEPLSCIAEELADVTTPSKAPGNWGILVRRGLKRGITIFAISQRWQEADKTAFGNASDYVVFRSQGGEDATYIKRKTGIDAPTVPLDHIELDALTGVQKRGRINFRGGQ